MSNRILRKIRHIFENMLAWDLVKKSQVVLIYSIVLKVGLLAILFLYQNHPLLDVTVAKNLSYVLLGFILANLSLLLTGFLIRSKPDTHEKYSLVVVLYYVTAVLLVPVMIGLLNIVNGLIVITTMLICMVFFPKRIALVAQSVFAVGYGALIVLTLLKYLDYGLIFQPNALINPLLMNAYILVSVSYSLIYVVISLYLFKLSLEAWREQLNSRENILDYRDSATGLLNECGIRQVASLQLKQAYLVSAELSMVVLDIDNFKRILEQHGTEYEEKVIKHVGSVLRTNLRASDMIARYDVEQFILILAFTPLNRAEDVAEMCRKTLEQNILQLENGQTISVKASFGVSSTVYNDFEFVSLLSSAQKALVLAKENGKNQVCTVDVVSS